MKWGLSEAEQFRLIAKMEADDERIALEVEKAQPDWDVFWKCVGFFRLEEELRLRFP